MKQNIQNQSQSHLIMAQVSRIVLSILQLISCIIYLIYIDIQIQSISAILILSICFPHFLYFCYWMRIIYKVEMKNKQIEIRRSTHPKFKKIGLLVSWIPLCILMSILQKLNLSGYAIFHYIYSKFGIMLTSDLIELMTIDADQRNAIGMITREKTVSKQNTYIEIKQNNNNINHEIVPLQQQQLSLSGVNNHPNFNEISPQKNLEILINNNTKDNVVSNNDAIITNNNVNNSRVINPIQIQLQQSNSQSKQQNRSQNIRKKIIQTQTRELDEDLSPIQINNNNNHYLNVYNTPIKRRAFQLDVDSPIKNKSRQFGIRRKTQRGSVNSNIDPTMTTFGNYNSREIHLDGDNNINGGKQFLNQFTRSSTMIGSLYNGYDEHALSLTANQKFQTNRFLFERYYQLITTHSNFIEFLFSVIPCIIGQIVNNEIGIDTQKEQVVGYICLTISAINFIANIIYLYAFLFEEELLQYFFSSINQIEKKREQLFNVAKAKQCKINEQNQRFNNISQNMMLSVIGVFPFPERIELNTIEKVHQLSNCNENSLIDIKSIHVNIPGKNLTFEEILQDFQYIFSNAINTTQVKLSLSCNRIKDDTINNMVKIILSKIGHQLKSFELLYDENQTTTKGEFELREQIASWDCRTNGISQKRIVGDQYISYRPEKNTDQLIIQKDLEYIFECQINKNFIQIAEFHFKQIEITEEILDLIQNFIQETISLNWLELHLNPSFQNQLSIDSILSSIQHHSYIQTCFLTTEILNYGIMKKKEILNLVKLELMNDLKSLQIEHQMNALNYDLIESLFKQKVSFKAPLSKFTLSKQDIQTFCSILSQFQNIDLLEFHIKNSQVDDENLQQIFKSITNPHLLNIAVIKLKQNRISMDNQTIETLVQQLKSCEKIYIDLCKNQINQTNSELFVQAFEQFQKLTHITIRLKDNPITSQSAIQQSFNKYISNCPHIQKKILQFEKQNRSTKINLMIDVNKSQSYE
ncbi:transmembrane protein, putative (macronuclear) [Tetrahymena thermophila SB210]|uniref:Transmembrane protein, putative n=1 Tax=Tetrahymena thermophila (strain SB210) TaxID=312017 RepID=Q244Z3_TETTS|nr:transmembrane protein, putative [Tetrahymena thermophila SB210]EAS03344.2 transmembrane protein, putative [Tetrahymena thermophila SB210]|eukprot:XP_001023589.2 transmembrane protein, putative [Tetrahymena thermophila SB210]